jgi:hypothetical protein
MASSFSALPKRQQMIIMYGAPAAVAILLIYFIYKALGTLGPIDNEIDPSNKFPRLLQRKTEPSLWADIRAAQAEIATQEAIIKRGPAVDAKLESLKSDIKMAEERLPRETEKSEMRAIIERLAREIPADIGTVVLNKVSIVDNSGERNNLRTITFQADITGDTDGIIKYIDSLEKNQRFMSVNSLSIRSGGLSADRINHKVAFGLHSVKMEIVTYVYNPGKK